MRVPVIITITDEFLPQIDEVYASVVAAGLEDAVLLPATGTITGTIEDTKRYEFFDIPGVGSLEDEQMNYTLGGQP